MIPAILAATSAVSLLDRLFSGGADKSQSRMAASMPSDKTFSEQLQTQSKKLSADSVPDIQSLLTALHGGAQLPLEQQMMLATRLVNHQVQVTDSGGNSRIGLVRDIMIQNGKVHLQIGGNMYPLSSVRAVMNGIANQI